MRMMDKLTSSELDSSSRLVFYFALDLTQEPAEVSCCFVLNELVADKESRMRETLRIMSLDRWAYAYLTLYPTFLNKEYLQCSLA